MIRPFLTILLAATVLLPLSEAYSASPPFNLPKDVGRLRSAIIYTDYGNVSLELYPDQAPWHVANFKYLADKGYYKDTQFHIFQTGYILQGGDRTGTGRAGPGYSIPPEFSDTRHEPGTLGMARSADYANPGRESHGGSQFYIILGKARHMDGQYTIFGRVREGMEIVKTLRRGDRIIDLKVFVKAEENSGTSPAP